MPSMIVSSSASVMRWIASARSLPRATSLAIKES